jgi:hypothetical protein
MLSEGVRNTYKQRSARRKSRSTEDIKKRKNLLRGTKVEEEVSTKFRWPRRDNP